MQKRPNRFLKVAHKFIFIFTQYFAMRMSICKERIFSPSTSVSPFDSNELFPYLPLRYGKAANTKRETIYNKLKGNLDSNRKMELSPIPQNPEKKLQFQYPQNTRSTNKNKRLWDHDKINRKGMRHSEILNAIIQILKTDPDETGRQNPAKEQKRAKMELQTQRNEFIQENENEERPIFSVRNNRYPKLVKSDIMKFRLQRKKEIDSKSNNRYKTQTLQSDEMELTFYRPRPMFLGRKQIHTQRRNITFQHEK